MPQAASGRRLADSPVSVLRLTSPLALRLRRRRTGGTTGKDAKLHTEERRDGECRRDKKTVVEETERIRPAPHRKVVPSVQHALVASSQQRAHATPAVPFSAPYFVVYVVEIDARHDLKQPQHTQQSSERNRAVDTNRRSRKTRPVLGDATGRHAACGRR